MTYVQLKSKFKAAFIHLLVTAAFATSVIILVINFWFPYNTLSLLKGWEIFLLILACDIALGPVLSFVVFNPSKKIKERILDYSVIATIQLAALLYGLNMLSQNRLLFLAFSVDRYEAVSAGEISKADLAKASEPQWREPGYMENFVVGVQPPASDSAEFFGMIFSGLEGRDLQYFPELYRDLSQISPAIQDRVQPLSRLSATVQEKLLKAAPTSMDKSSLAWLPLSHNKVFWTMLVNKNTGMPLKAIPVDPYENMNPEK